MSNISERLQKTFLEQYRRLTQSTTSLRARIRNSVQGEKSTTPGPLTTVNTPPPVRNTNAPEGTCIYAIGDIHGRADLLEILIDRIKSDSAALPEGTQVQIVFLGDYIDRGLQSRRVIDFFLGDELDDFETVFLMGNHEEALLRFFDDEDFGKQWVRYGGGETLYSYGFQPPNSRASLSSHESMAAAQEAWRRVWEGFREKLPEDHLEFYRSLKHYHIEGDYLFVHAGLRPDVSLEEQTQRDMLWIRDEFLDDSGQFQHLIVHGHTPTEGIVYDGRRIGLDTGAFISGRLSAARLFGSEVIFLST